MKAKTKSVEVGVMEFDGSIDSWNLISDWVGNAAGWVPRDDGKELYYFTQDNFNYSVSNGDRVVKLNGEFYLFKESVYKAFFESQNNGEGGEHF